MLGSVSLSNIIGGLIFSGIGMVALATGKQEMNVKLMLLGAALTVYCFFVDSTLLLYAIGTGLSVAAYYARE